MTDYNGMIDYSGWIEINIDIDDVCIDTSNLLTKFFEAIEPLISNFNESFRSVTLRHVNWVDMYQIFGAHNHNIGYLDDVLNLYKAVGEKAPGSFGLLYVRLPEHPIYWNKYRVFRLAKGVLTEHEDTLLSPCNPVIENDV